MSNKHLKQKYNDTFKIVKKAVNDWDPVRLLPDAPDNEYEYEIGRIVSLLSKVDSVKALSEGIAQIFSKAFDWRFSEEECVPVARIMWAETKQK